MNIAAMAILLVMLVCVGGCGCSSEAKIKTTDVIKVAPVEILTTPPTPMTKHLAVDPVAAERYRLNEEIANIDGQKDMKTRTIDRIATKFGEVGPPCWIPEDVNCDGIIDVLDMIPVGQIEIAGE